MIVELKNLQDKNVKFETGKLVSVNGVVFKLSSISTNPLSFTLQPANSDQVREFAQTTQDQNIHQPSLSDGSMFRKMEEQIKDQQEALEGCVSRIGELESENKGLHQKIMNLQSGDDSKRLPEDLNEGINQQPQVGTNSQLPK